MTKTEHLLTILGEECSEVHQRATKALRFGLNEIELGQMMTNSERIELELDDLWSVAQMLISEGLIKGSNQDRQIKKKQKVEKFLEYSKIQGTLN